MNANLSMAVWCVIPDPWESEESPHGAEKDWGAFLQRSQRKVAVRKTAHSQGSVRVLLLITSSFCLLTDIPDIYPFYAVARSG